MNTECEICGSIDRTLVLKDEDSGALWDGDVALCAGCLTAAFQTLGSTGYNRYRSVL